MKIWKTIKIRKLTRKQLEKAGIKVSEYAAQMLSKVKWQEKGKIDLVRIKVGELFEDQRRHTTEEIYAKAEERGLTLCPAEVAPALRLEYKDQPIGEWLWIGMKQIRDGNPRVFHLARHGDGLWLDGPWTKPSHEWPPGYGFVFRLRKLRNLNPLNLDSLESRLSNLESKMAKLEKIVNLN